jgi:hypothetical protein
VNVKWTLRPVAESDWGAIARVADEAAPHATGGNRAWLQARMGFDETVGTRRQYVAVDDGGAVRGYGAIEDAARDGRYRVFVVTAPSLLEAAGEELLARLLGDLAELGATRAWMREEANDEALLSFARRHGFAEVSRYGAMTGEPPAPLDVVMLERAM